MRNTTTALLAVTMVFGLLTVGAVGAASASGDAGAGYLAYKAYQGDLTANNALAGTSALLGGLGTGFKGAATAVGAYQAAGWSTVAVLGTGAAVAGGALAL